jgi:hypothetical protein
MYPPRLPDFVSGQLNIGLGPEVPFGWSGQLIIDRNGNIYIQPIGSNLGKSATVVSYAGTIGWLDQPCRPTDQQLNDVISDQSIGIGGGFVIGVEETANSAGSTKQIGAMSPQIGGSWGWAKQVGHIPIAW